MTSITRNIPSPFQFALTMLTGLLAGGMLILDVPIKWKITYILALGFTGFLFYIRKANRALLFVIAFAVPLYIGKDFIVRPEHIGLVRVVGLHITDILVITLLMLYLGRMALGQVRLRLFPSTTLPALFWLVISGFSLLYARDTELTAIHLFTMGKLFVLYLVVANSVNDEDDVKWITRGLLFGLLFQGLLGSYQGVTGNPLGLTTLGETTEVERMAVGQGMAFRSRGTVGHANGYAMYLVTVIPFALALLFTRVKGLWKGLSAIALCAGTLGLLFSLSRGGWIGFVIVLIAVSFFAVRRFQIRGRSAALVLFAALFVILTLIFVGPDLISSRLFSSDQGSAMSRITMAKGALAIIMDHPFSGVGLNNYTLFMFKYDWATFLEHGGPMVVHNVFLLIAAETGLLGLAAFVWLLTSVIASSWNSIRRATSNTYWLASAGIFSAYLSFAVHGMVDFALLWDLTLFTQFWLLAGLAAGIGGRLDGRDKIKQDIDAQKKMEAEFFPIER